MDTKVKGDYYVEPGQEVTVDFFRPQDAEGVVGCFKAVYGDGYPVRVYYDPAELIAANADKRIISSVARTTGGEVVGHNAMFRYPPNEKLYEAGAGVVLPAYRSGGLFGKMVSHNTKVAAPRFGVEMVYGEPVCNHVISQVLCHSQGWITMALEMDLMPAAAYSKEKSAPGRVSALLAFGIIKPRPQQVYLPQAYQEELEFLYASFPEQRAFTPAQAAPPAGSASRMDMEVFDFARVARITVHQVGEDLAREVADHQARAAQKGCTVFQVRLPLTVPWVGASLEALRDDGWFLGGVLPRWFDEGDGLLMQKLSHPPGWDDMKLEFERSRQIAGLVRRDWERTVSG